MLLSKETAVYLNLAACKLKQYTAQILKQNNVAMTPEQFLVVDLLWNEGSMSQQSLADKMHKDKNSITKLVDALEKKGLVCRQQDKNDRRSNIIVLTDTAQIMKLDAKEKGISMLDKIVENIDENDLHTFLKVINQLLDNMEVEE